MATNVSTISPRNLRALMGLSQAKFASVLGCSVRSVNRWERNRYFPSNAYRFRLQSLLMRVKDTRRNGKQSRKGHYLTRFDLQKALAYVNGENTGDWQHKQLMERVQHWKHKRKYMRLLSDPQAVGFTLDSRAIREQNAGDYQVPIKRKR